MACSVPDLQLDILLIDLHGTGSELNSNSQVVLLAESLVSELEQQAGFTHTYRDSLLAIKLKLTCVPDDNILNKIGV